MCASLSNQAQYVEQNLNESSKSGAKDQLISKCPFGVIFWTKIPPKNLTNSALEWVVQNLSNFFVGILVQTMTPKGHFEIN